MCTELGFNYKEPENKDSMFESDFYSDSDVTYKRSKKDYDPQFYIDLYNFPKDWVKYHKKYEFPYEHEMWDEDKFGPDFDEEHGNVCSWNIGDQESSDPFTEFDCCISYDEKKILNNKGGFAYVSVSENKDGTSNIEVKPIKGNVKNKKLQELNDLIGDLIIFSHRFKHIKDTKSYYNNDDVSGCSLCKILYGKHTFEVKKDEAIKVAEDDSWICENCPCMLRCRNHDIVKNYAR